MNNFLDIYSDYLIAQNQYATAVGLSDLLEGRISRDKITRFLNSNDFSSIKQNASLEKSPTKVVRSQKSQLPQTSEDFET